MVEWDRILIGLVAVGAAIPPVRAGWQAWGRRELKPAVGAGLLVVATVGLSVLLFFFGQ